MTGQIEPQGAAAATVDLGSFPQAGVAVVFGASGVIGGALVEAIRAAGRFEHVVALGCADWSMTPAPKHAIVQLS
jgi:hypothetical protein